MLTLHALIIQLLVFASLTGNYIHITYKWLPCQAREPGSEGVSLEMGRGFSIQISGSYLHITYKWVLHPSPERGSGELLPGSEGGLYPDIRHLHAYYIINGCYVRCNNKKCDQQIV